MQYNTIRKSKSKKGVSVQQQAKSTEAEDDNVVAPLSSDEENGDADLLTAKNDSIPSTPPRNESKIPEKEAYFSPTPLSTATPPHTATPVAESKHSGDEGGKKERYNNTVTPTRSEKPQRATPSNSSEEKSATRSSKPSSSSKRAESPVVSPMQSEAEEHKHKSDSKTEVQQHLGESKGIPIYSKPDIKCDDKKSTSGEKKEGLNRSAPSTPIPPSHDPPVEIIASFHSAKKAIENSGGGKGERPRSDSLDEILKDHPTILDPSTGEIVANLIPSDDVMEHQQRLFTAKTLINVGPSSPSLQSESSRSPNLRIAYALTDTAKALEGKIFTVYLFT